MDHIVFAKPVLVFVPFLAEFATADYNQIIVGLLTSYLAKSIVNWRDRLLLMALASVLAQGNT
jgi:hypothetical protein